MATDLESAILARAVEEGLLTEDDRRRVEDEVQNDDTRSRYEGRWGARIDALIALARLDEAAVARLAAAIDPAATPPPAPPEPAGSAELPASWDRYRILELLAEGGMGRVFSAYDPRLERFVALKLLRPTRRRNTAELLAEARAQARIAHDNVLEIYEVGEIGGQPYIAMQLIQGRTLRDAGSTLPFEQRLRVLEAIARAVHAAHEVGLVHRDIKPSNILLEESERGELKPYIADFGLAQELERPAGAGRGGTPGYMAPEQRDRDDAMVDRRADVYGLGATLFHALSGTRPPESVSANDLDPRWPADVAAILLKCLARDPAHRYPSARALAEDLRRYREGEPVLARSQSLTYQARKWVQRNRTASAAITAVLVIGAIAGVRELRARRIAAEEAELGRRFGERLEGMAAIVRYSDMLPLHDVRREEARLREELARLEAEVAGATGRAERLGHYAIGSALLLVKDHARAEERLRLAHDPDAPHPEIAEALGRALAALYEAEQDRALRDRKPAATADRLREEALPLLELGAGGEDADPMLAATIAFHRRRFAEAHARSAEAIARAPWLYEAKLLSGRIFIGQGEEHQDARDMAAAREAYEQAADAYEQALAIARSNAEAHGRLCALRANMLYLQVYHFPGDAEPAYARAESACSSALIARPDNTAALHELSRARKLYAEDLRARGRPALPALAGAVEAARAAIELDPADAYGHNSLGNAYRVLGEYQIDTGLESDDSIARAVSTLARATHLDPDEGVFFNNLGNAHRAAAYLALLKGEDPGEAFAGAIAAYERSIAIDGHHSPRVNLGATLLELAELHVDEPERARTELARARERLEIATEERLRDAYALTQLARARVLEAELSLREGQTAAAAAAGAAAAELIERARLLDDGSARVPIALAALAGIEAAIAPRDARRVIDRARAALDPALEAHAASPTLLEARAKLAAAALRALGPARAAGDVRAGREAVAALLRRYPRWTGAQALLAALTVTD